jgi:16S rRNA (guanine527-N7)-methyltransferase
MSELADTLAAGLANGLAALGLALPAAAKRQLLDYLALLKKWNAAYNLTAIRDEREMLTHHLLDSLSVLSVLQKSALAGRRWADVGSGAGLPGIPLAIARPDWQLTSIETVEKKAAFQRQAKITLGLANLQVVSGRVEAQPAGLFDAVISRAFAELADFARLAGHLLVPGGALYAMKGRADTAEIARLTPPWRIAECLPLRVPGLDAERHLLVLRKDG